MSKEKKEEFSGYILLQDFRNLWEFKMACMKRDHKLTGKKYPGKLLEIIARIPWR
jgi:hypothetical protein